MPAKARLLAALVPWAALAGLAAASAAASALSEAEIRRELAAAAREAATAKSLAARGVVGLRSESGGRLVPLYRLEFRLEKGEELKTDDRRFPAGHWGRPTNEVLTVGEGVWWRAKAGRYREGTIALGLADGTTSELRALERAAKVDKHVKEIGVGRYELTAPSSAFNGPQAGHAPVRLVATLSGAGHLRQLRRFEGEGFGAAIVFAQTFADLGRPFGISAPPPESIAPGPIRHIADADELAGLFGIGPSAGD